MKKALITAAGLLVLTLALTGCAGQVPADIDIQSEGTGDYVEVDKPIEHKERIDDWKPSGAPARQETEGLSLKTEDSEEVKIVFTEENKKEMWESYTGGADADFAHAEIKGDAPDTVKGILEDYNLWVTETTESELKAAKERWERYHAADPDSFIALTPRIGMWLGRCDTSIVSYVTVVDRYNRDYEPDDTFLHGFTFDAGTGRKLSLGDLVSDKDRLAELACESLVTANGGHSNERTLCFLDEDFKKAVHDSITGDRDDGLFAWSLNSEGFDVYFASPFYKEDYLPHDVEKAFIPFGSCRDILNEELDAPYDHIYGFYRSYLSDVYGVTIDELPEVPEGGFYYTLKVVKDGRNYLYLSGEDETRAYSMDEDRPRYIGRVFGEVATSDSYSYESIIDPESFLLKGSTFLVQEYLNLVAETSVGEDGSPKPKELFRMEYSNVTPLRVLEPFEAEVYSDEKDITPEKKMLSENEELFFLNTDGETFIDLKMGYEGPICRLYIEGSYEDGFTVNGRPQEEIIEEVSWLEE